MLSARIASLVALCGLALVAGCASLPNSIPDPVPGASPQRADLDATPFHPQLDFHCGPATLLTVLEASGVRPEYDEVVERVYVPGLEGSLQAEMTAATRSFGRIAYRVPGTLEALIAQIDAGFPVLVLKNLALRIVPAWHYAVVIGYDRDHDRVLLRSGGEPVLDIPVRRFMAQWDRAGRWALVILEPGELPAEPDRTRLFRALADFERHAEPRVALAAWQPAADHWPAEAVAWLGVGNARYQLDDL